MMKIATKNHRKARVFIVNGEINLSTVQTLVSTIAESIKPGKAVVLDMNKVSYLSSAGIRALLLMYREITASGGKMILVGLSTELTELLDLTGFLEFFETYPSVESGIRSVA